MLGLGDVGVGWLHAQAGPVAGRKEFERRRAEPEYRRAEDCLAVDCQRDRLANFGTNQPSNAVRYSNPKADELIAAGVATTDQAKRKQVYQQLQQLLLDDAPWINLYIAQQFEAMKTYVKGYTHIPTGTNYTLKDVWLDK